MEQDLELAVTIMRRLGIVEMSYGEMTIKLSPMSQPLPDMTEADAHAILNPLNTPVNEEAALFWSADGGPVYGSDGKRIDVPLMGEEEESDGVD